MLSVKHVKPCEIIKVLVKWDEIEEELYAKVLKNYGESLMVTYLGPTSKVYKSATVYEFDSKPHLVKGDSICEYHEDNNDIETIGIRKVGQNQFVFDSEVNSDDESDIVNHSDSEDDNSLKDFIVSDTEEIEQGELDETLEAEWDTWEPRTKRSKQVKDVVDRIKDKYVA